MDALLPYLGSAAGPIALMFAGGAVVLAAQKYIRRENTSAFEAAVAPFLAAIESLKSLPDRFDQLEQQQNKTRETLEGMRSAVESQSRTVEAAHAMAVEALKVANRVEGAQGAIASQLATHIHRIPHSHTGPGGSGHSD